MKKKINFQLMGIAIAVMVITLVLSVVVCYQAFITQVVDDLRIQTRVLNNLLPELELETMLLGRSYSPEEDLLRITVIAPDGQVVYDSGTPVEQMENHNDRPEIINAREQGEGWAVRRSETRGIDTFYYAMETEDGAVLRLSQQAGNILQVFLAVLPLMGVIMVLLVLVCITAAHFLAESLIDPIKAVTASIEKQEEIVTYEELQPFINTIRKQSFSILKSAKIRQDFTANVSHELKTPLTAISGYSELIKNGMVSDQEDVTRFAREIYKNSDRLLILINDVIRLSELDADQGEEILERINLREIAETCVSMLQMNAEKHNVTIEMQGQDAYILSTRQMTEELIFNLCDNAIRYNKAEGSVQVSVRKRGEKVVLKVQDTGIGIPAEHQERIFERFYRVDKSRSKSTGGTGLGLAIVKHILARHGAEIKIESEVGRGTLVKVIFAGTD